jgi:hypothetical protein
MSVLQPSGPNTLSARVIVQLLAELVIQGLQVLLLYYPARMNVGNDEIVRAIQTFMENEYELGKSW